MFLKINYMRYLPMLFLSLLPTWANSNIEIFNDENREDQSEII